MESWHFSVRLSYKALQGVIKPSDQPNVLVREVAINNEGHNFHVAMRMFSKSLSQDMKHSGIQQTSENMTKTDYNANSSLPHERSQLQRFSWSLSQFQSSFCLHQIVVHHTQHTKAAGPFAVLCKVEVKARFQPILVGPSLPVLKTQKMLCNHRCLKKSIATVCFAAHGSFFRVWSIVRTWDFTSGFLALPNHRGSGSLTSFQKMSQIERRRSEETNISDSSWFFYLEKEHEGREMDHKKEGQDFTKTLTVFWDDRAISVCAPPTVQPSRNWNKSQESRKTQPAFTHGSVNYPFNRYNASRFLLVQASKRRFSGMTATVPDMMRSVSLAVTRTGLSTSVCMGPNQTSTSKKQKTRIWIKQNVKAKKKTVMLVFVSYCTN